MFEMVIYHEKTVMMASKNCDKLIYYIDRITTSIAFFSNHGRSVRMFLIMLQWMYQCVSRPD